MEKDFYNDDLDSLLQKTDEYLMYPSEGVWNRIRIRLFLRRNWISMAGSVLFVCLLFFIPESFLNTIFPSPGSRVPLQKGNLGSARSAVRNAFSPSNAAQRISSLKSTPGDLVSRPSASSTALVTMQPALLSGTSSAPVIKASAAVYRMHPVKPAAVTAPLTKPGQDIDIASHFLVSSPVENPSGTEPAAENTELPVALPEETTGTVNWLQDMAVIRLTPKKKGPFNLQFYFSPLVSYRKLSENDLLGHNNGNATPLTSNPKNVNAYVDHQPSIGVELGSNVLYRVGKNLTLKTGLQMNYSRYTIKAYKTGYEKASIALNAWGRVDTLTSYTTIRNFNGYLQEQLQNQYVQISVPVGAEFKVLGNKRLQFNIAGTLQPTFLLFNDTYLLSTDYINYTKEPSLVRRWNVHTSAEAYLSYQFANVRWQVGPQFRYQTFSSYHDQYPIKEYLIEYGIKFGISKTLR